MTVIVNDTKWREIAAKVAKIGQYVAKVGIVGPNATQEENGTSLVEIAAVNEFGSRDGTIPERSFIRSTFERQRRAVGKICERLARQIVTKGMDVSQAMSLLGAWGASEVRKTITGGHISPPNAPATLAAKGSSKPLIDTGQLVAGITYEVSDHEGGQR